VADALGARIDELQFGGDLQIGDARIHMDHLLPSKRRRSPRRGPVGRRSPWRTRTYC
jgi:hypothetical protein